MNSATVRSRIKNTSCFTSLRAPRVTLWAEISKLNPDCISYDSAAKLTYLLHPTDIIFKIAKRIPRSYIHIYVAPFISLSLMFAHGYSFSCHALFITYSVHQLLVIPTLHQNSEALRCPLLCIATFFPINCIVSYLDIVYLLFYCYFSFKVGVWHSLQLGV